jgi:hypothetical protein
MAIFPSILSFSMEVISQDTTNVKLPETGVHDSSKLPVPKNLRLDVCKPRVKSGFGRSLDKTFGSLKKVTATGQISLGYDYGVIPFAYNLPAPSGYFHAEGSAGVRFLSVPFNASFFYSDLKNVPGVNNYFRFVYNPGQYKNEIRQKVVSQQGKLEEELEHLYEQKQFSTQKLYFYKHAKLNLDKYHLPNPKLPSKDLPQLPNLPHPDSSLAPQLPFDSSSVIGLQNHYKDSLALKHRADSINEQVTKYEEQVKEITDKINKTKAAIETLKDPKKLIANGKGLLSKTGKFFADVKKLEVGMCYPDYSTFLVNGTALKGVNLEYQHKDFYLAFVHGKTVNTFLTTTNTVQNQLFNIQNLYNFFDFNYVRDSRKISSIKCGYGKKEENHLYFGLLYGLGLPSYISNTTPAIYPHVTVPDRNFVVEIDGKYVMNEKSTFTLIYGRSNLQTLDQYFPNGENTIDAFMRASHSNAAMGRYFLTLPKTGTKLIVTGRWVDSFFKSFGVSSIRSDNFRCELKGEQQLGKKIKFSGFYRRDEDNLLSIYNYKTILQTIGANLSIKIRRSLTLRFGYNPVIQKVDTRDNTYDHHNVNTIANVLVSYFPMLKKGSTLFSGMYNYYYLTTAETNSEFQNITFSNLTQFKKFFKNNFTAGWFSCSGDSMFNRTWLITDELGFTSKKGACVAIGLKGAFNEGPGLQYGYLAKAIFPVIGPLSLELDAERLVPGDFYNSLNYYEINKFPYYFNGKAVITW